MTAATKRERLKQERRDSIVNAAVRVFHARGIQAATMDEIAREAGVSKGTLYLYFASKDELFLTVAIEWLDHLQHQIDELQKEEFETGLDLVRAGAKTYARHSLKNPRRFQVAMSWLNTDYTVNDATPLFRQYRAAIAEKHKFMIGGLERAMKDGSLVSSEAPIRIGLQLWGSLLGLILLEQHSEELTRRFPVKPPTEGICDAFVDNFLNGLGAERSRPPHLKSVPPLESEE